MWVERAHGGGGAYLAVAKILGFHRNQVARAVAWQATTIAAVGVAVGVPTGVVVGRVAFTVLADAVSVPTVVVLSMVVLMAASAAILVANIAALAPSGVAARTRPAAVLRAE
jgi:putative ABC transport system permease protein